MTIDHNDPFGAVIRKLGRWGRLGAEDRAAIRALPLTIRNAAAHEYLVTEGQEVATCCLLLAGYACRHKSTIDGGRQIVSFHMAGDILDLQHLLLSRADHNLQTITEATVATVASAELKRVAAAHPAIADALWRDTLVEASILREWVLNVGRRDGRSRVAHLLCEFAARQEAAGIGEAGRFTLPMTQDQIADATGLTGVHVNRMLAALEADGLIARDKRRIEIVDPSRMREAAGFDAAYLHAAA